MTDSQFGLRHVIGAPVATTRLSEQAIVCVPPRSAKFTLAEWKLNNDTRSRNAEDQAQLADRVLKESERVRDKTKEGAKLLKETTDRRIEERIGDIEFNKGELMVQRKEIYNELEALGMYKTRLQDCLASLQSNALTICRKCLMLRDGRLGIDLAVDNVEDALQTEITTILGGQSLLKRALEQLNEQMRRLRSVRYLLDRDLQYKQAAIDSDKGSLILKPTDLCLSVYEGYANLDPADISAEEYNAYSAKNIQQAAREVSSARPIRIFIDTLLKQVINDLWTAYNKCNHEFNERIKETHIEKARLEEMHHQTAEKVFDMQNNILELKKALADKEAYIGLAHTRLGRRSQRVGAELVKDPPGQALYYECESLRHSVEELQQMLQEATSSLRYLLQTQIQLEEDINIKMNTLKIDEVDCMTLRATMDYHSY
ncbi:tektin-1 [Leguminivora glycinivorella]|uniref:tektin-1 n=1 Tax=Leguminivora glycinivorella TaxID=1035111 RepID=UPI00201015E4|nr:tektin-1 [Leguminivora glycinivorella]